MEKKHRQIILVVDDSLLICKQIRTALEGEDVFLCEAHNGLEALELIGQYQPDLILLDVVLPDIEGYELFGKLREADKNDASILFLTSKDKEEDVIKGFSIGACDYIKKPFEKGELHSRVHAHLLLKRQRDELNRRNQELESSMAKLNYMAFRDGLTGLYNRRYVIGDLMEDIRGRHSEERKNVLILADIDDFKMINDTYGHEAGDTALVCIANILESICRKHRVIRWGGEEFLMVLFSVTEQEAEQISEQIRSEVERFEILHESGKIQCTLTLGLHVYQEDQSLEENIKYADKALYKGKGSGKNRSVWYRGIE